MKRIQLQPGFVLHRRAYRETSWLVEILSAEHGRLSVMAKGARGARSKQYATLQLFQPLLLSWSGRGEMPYLNGVEHQGPAVMLSPKAMVAGFYVNELVIHLTHRHDAQPELFAAYIDVLNALNESDRVEWPLRLFEKRLLSAIGYGLILDADAHGMPLEPEKRYHYWVERGALPAQSQDQLTISGRALHALAKGQACPDEQLRELKTLMRQVLGHYLGGRRLRSQELVRGL